MTLNPAAVNWASRAEQSRAGRVSLNVEQLLSTWLSGRSWPTAGIRPVHSQRVLFPSGRTHHHTHATSNANAV